MILSEVVEILGCEVHACTGKLKSVITSACGSDLMSDVMAFSKENAMLLTGLVNPQVVRTAEMMDIRVVVFVRGKKPTGGMCEMAEEKGIVLLSTDLPMFVSCGVLYKAGIEGRGTSCG